MTPRNCETYFQGSKQQRFIPGTVDSEGITALAVSANRKLLAVAEKAEKAMVTVYDLQVNKLLSFDLQSNIVFTKGIYISIACIICYYIIYYQDSIIVMYFYYMESTCVPVCNGLSFNDLCLNFLRSYG